MKHTYAVSGMTCGGCANTVKRTLATVPNVTDVQIDLAQGIANITTSQEVPFEKLQESLKNFPAYKISERDQK